MAHRPYPNSDRALRQLGRHERPAAASLSGAEQLENAAAVLSMSGVSARELSERWQGALDDPRYRLGEYRLSTR